MKSGHRMLTAPARLAHCIVPVILAQTNLATLTLGAWRPLQWRSVLRLLPTGGL